MRHIGIRAVLRRALLMVCLAQLAPPPAAAVETMGVDEIRPGMKGVGRTVFQGTKIEEFQVEIMGVLRNASANGDIILAKAFGGPLEEAGIIQGMSGSPVYVDGKLIGALSMGWSFSKQPIGGITPIAEMLDVMAREDRPAAEEHGPLGALAPLDDVDEPTEEIGIALGDWIPHSQMRHSDARLRRIQTPISVAGFDSRVFDEMAPWLGGLGFVASPGGAATQQGGEDYEAVPGAAVGVQLVSGDASVTAIGTVTYREGDRLIAFGHPFFQAGHVHLPMTGVWIHGVLPSSLSSFKLGSPLGPLGTLTQDRRPAIAGNIGSSPRTIPVKINVETDEGLHSYNFEIVKDKRLTPGLIRFTAVNSLVAREGLIEESTTRTRTRIQIENGESIVLENLFAGFSSLGGVIEEASLPVEYLLQNRFERLDVESVDMDVTMEPGRRSGTIEAITLSKNPVRPGETVTVKTTVKLYQGPTRVIAFDVAIPPGTPDGELQLRVCDASTLNAADLKRAPLRNDWRDIETFLRRIRQRRRNDRIHVQLEEPSVGISIAGRELPSVPRSFFSVIDSNRHEEDAGVITSSVLAEQQVDMDLVVSGCNTIPIIVDSKLR